jgi:hypothetical protein
MPAAPSNDLDFEHLLAATLEVRRKGYGEWTDLSLRERAFVALCLNKPDWLSRDELTIAGSLDLIGPQLVNLVPAVERAINR